MENAWTVTELCQYIKGLLDNDELLRFAAVKGEISNASLYPSGHLYLTLKDQKSQIAGVMFSAANRLKFKPTEGMKVLAFGQVSIFSGKSQYQLILQDLQPDGIGELFLAFQQLKEKLEKEGLFQPSRKRPIPFFPKVIGIVTSLQGRAVHDMLTIIQRRNPAVRVILSPSLVQGAEAPPALIAALQRLQGIPEVEAVIVSRGGGAPEELWAFNDEMLARAISACRVPVISAIGHETDFTIADFVADQRAPTPSAAAELITPDSLSLLQQLTQLEERVRLGMLKRLQEEEQRVFTLLQRPIFRFPGERIQRESQSLDLLSRRLHETYQNSLKFSGGSLSTLFQKLEALSPLATLKRGYVLVSRGGQLLKSVKEVGTGGKIRLLFHDGEVEATPTPQKKTRALTAQQTLLFP